MRQVQDDGPFPTEDTVLTRKKLAGKAWLLVGLLGLAAPAPRAEAQSGTEAQAQARLAAAAAAWSGEGEVFYQIFVRSFRDGNGDRVGDLRGIQDELGYLQELGVISLLLTPVNPSPFYHNYFATSFEGVDPAYGDVRALHALIEAVHGRKMKIYLDEEVQYVAGNHPWWKESAGRPDSKYSHYLLYHGPGNTEPESAVFNLTLTPTWDGAKIPLTTVNMLEPAVKRYFQQLFLSLVDPNHDGRFDDGVDGFRLDHMMDDLDSKGILKNLFAEFWAPIFARARALNPRIRIIAEQADWGFGDDFLARSGADMVFAFPLQRAIASLDRKGLADAITATVQKTPAGKGQLVFIENHDVIRYASVVGGDPRKERIGAALDVLLKGTPLIYYGQELGMKGKRTDAWTSDANDIPDREAMPWTGKEEAAGSAIWYRGDGPWWSNRYNRDGDGISVAQEKQDPKSLLSFYRRLLALRRTHPEIRSGDERVLDTDQQDVLAVLRSTPTRASLLLVNLADAPRTAVVDTSGIPATLSGGPLLELIANTPAGAGLRVRLAPLQVELLSPRGQRRR